jgi:DNA-binding beta-propeller fold protein YncE
VPAAGGEEIKPKILKAGLTKGDPALSLTGEPMSLQPITSIDLPGHLQPGGFDHAAIHHASQRLYVAHTANNALDVIDCASDRYLHSINGLSGVAGALVSEERGLVFTSNRGENTVGIFAPDDEQELVKVTVGVRPNGLSFDPRGGLLLAANVGNPDIPGSFTLSMVDIERREMIASVPVPGRTRWTIFDPRTEAFYINIADPARIIVVEAACPDRVARTLTIPAAGPHGLDLDAERQLLFCACDSARLFAIAQETGEIVHTAELSGTPDVIFFNPSLKHLYVAVGDPGVIDVFETETLTRLETVTTEKGAHTLAFDAACNKIYAFLPQTQRAQVFTDA